MDYSNLENQLKNKVCSFPGLYHIAYEEVIVRIAENKNKTALNNFIYVKVWIYKKEHRTRQLLASLQSEIGKLVYGFYKKLIKSHVMVEVLPIFELIDNDCFVVGSLAMP